MVLWKGVDGTSAGLQSGRLISRLYDYASLLASQGCLATALNYIAPVTSDDVRSTFNNRFNIAAKGWIEQYAISRM